MKQFNKFKDKEKSDNFKKKKNKPRDDYKRVRRDKITNIDLSDPEVLDQWNEP